MPRLHNRIARYISKMITFCSAAVFSSPRASAAPPPKELQHEQHKTEDPS